MFIGVDYYPEHWPEERWPRDAQLMQDAQFNVVRLAEFAWVMLEPEEGRYEFDWLDRALDILHNRGIKAILGTPTGSMPAWVAHKYPDTVAVDVNGHKHGYGARKDNCVSSGTFRLLSERITRAMAEHYAQHPAVIGWQTDNEFGGPYCYCDACKRSFHAWLRARYGYLDALNRAWGTRFWGHVYQKWDEIDLPRRGSPGWCPHANNPSLDLDFKRFYSYKTVEFQRDQVRIIRQLCPKHFITHNMMGSAPNINYFDLAADLDFVSWDSYPVWGDPEVPMAAAAAADLMRGIKGKNFWIMETNAGPGGSFTFGRNVRPGEIRRLAFQQLAHGADGYLWFRWRTCLSGREQYWHGFLGHDGVAGRRYLEAAQVASEFHQLAPELEGTSVPAEVAILYDYHSLWAISVQAGFAGNNYTEHLQRYHRALFRAGVPCDVVSPEADLSKYRIVLAPQLFVLPDRIAQKLIEFVRSGGILLADLRTGVKNETNLCHDRVLPGLLGTACGIRISEYEALGPNTRPRLVPNERALPADVISAAGSLTAILYADWITPTDAEVLFRYDEQYLEPYAAVTRNAFEKGFAYYVGTIAEEAAFYDLVVNDMLLHARVRPLVSPPPGVEVGLRTSTDAQYLFLINHTGGEDTVDLPLQGLNLLTGKKVAGQFALGANAVAVIKLARG